MADLRISDPSALKRLSALMPGWILPTKLRVVLQLLNGILFQYGWLHSLRSEKAVDAHGKPLPWITYPAIDFLLQLDLSGRSVFEWGAGQSTLFWAERAERVISVETDGQWQEYVRKLAPRNCEILLVRRECEAYSKMIERGSKFDIILIDGPSDFRPSCSERAIKYLKPGGMIILDNSDQSPISATILRKSHLIQVDFTGFAPGQGYATTTSIFFDRGYDFQPLNEIQPRKSVAQPNLAWENS